MSLLRLLLVTAAVMAATPAAAKDPADSIWREAQGRYQAKLKEEHIVASTTVLLRDGKVIEADNFGVGDIATKRPTDLKIDLSLGLGHQDLHVDRHPAIAR